MHCNYKFIIIKYFIATVWLANGLFCKVLNFVPRHEEIAARILGSEHARFYTILIGISEISMACWIILNKWSKLNAAIQIIVIATMNILEFFLAPDLLLWGKANAIFAALFILLIYYNEFHLHKKFHP